MSRALHVSVEALQAGGDTGLDLGAFQMKWAEGRALLKANLLTLMGLLLAYKQGLCKMLIRAFLKQHDRVEANLELGETSSAC